MLLLVLEMKVMVKEAKKFSSDVKYPENTKQGSDGSAQIRLPQELFGKYKGRASVLRKLQSDLLLSL